LFILIYVVFLFSPNYCFAAVVLIATNKVEYILQNGILIGSAVFARLTTVTDWQREWQTKLFSL